jgi:HlyD family secretion protein
MTTAPLPWLPASLAAHTVESLYSEHGRQRPWIYWLALLGVIGALVALPLVKVDVTVRAPGLVRPATERTELRVPLNAQIGQVLARNNEHVTAGQPLLILRSRDLDERIKLNHLRQREKSALIGDLRLLTSEPTPAPGESDSPATSPINSSRPPNPIRPLQSPAPISHALPPLALESPALSVAELRAEFVQHQAQFALHALATAKFAREFTRAKTLADQGLIAPRDLDQARDDLASAAAEHSTFLRSARARWAARLRDEESNLTTLRTEEKRLAEESIQCVLCAPLTGSVQGLSGLAPGAWLTAGQSLGHVSPDDVLFVEALVAARDIGLLQPGQRARLQIDAFPYTQWGLLDGVVAAIADDAGVASSSDRSVSFKVSIQPLTSTLHLPNGASGNLRKGMTVQARFLVTRRSLFNVLHEDVSAWLNPQEMAHPP